MGNPEDIHACAVCGIRDFIVVCNVPLSNLGVLRLATEEEATYYGTAVEFRQHFCVYAEVDSPHTMY